MTTVDVVVVGAGMAGVGAAAALVEQAPALRVLLLEAEAHPAYHATGRSAAFWHESYGGPAVRPLTDASFGPLAAAGALRPRGALTIGRAAGSDAVDAFVATYRAAGVAIERVGRATMAAMVPGLRADWRHAAHEPRCSDIDVAFYHQARLAVARRGGALLMPRARMERAARRDGAWIVSGAGFDPVRARWLVNAAGAWADDVAAAAGVARLGIAPYRRTVVQLRIGRPVPADLPLVIDVDGGFYFKPEGGDRIWLSPHDETPAAPGDVAAEELDVAIAIDRLGAVVDWPIAAVERRWAGLRSFAPDRLPVIGADPGEPTFLWCAGQGGFGIQTAPAVSALAAAAITGVSPGAGLEPLADGRYAPGRLAARATSSAASDAS